MEEHVLVDGTFTAVINAPIASVDLPEWCFNLPDEEYQDCSPAHFAAGSSRTRDGRRMSINVEVIGGTPLIEHYVERLGEPHHLVLDSVTDLFAPNGRTKILVTWELSVKALNPGQCELRNHVRSAATDHFLDFLARQGIPLEAFRAQRSPMSMAHVRDETPFFAASIERFALRRATAA